MMRILPGSKRDDMIAAYLAGERVAEIARRNSCPRSTLYAVLRAAGLGPSRRAVARRSPTPAHFCVVCGGAKRDPSSGHRSGGWFTKPTCGDPSCVSMLMYVPHRVSAPGIKFYKRRWLRTEEAISYEEMRAYDEDFDQSDVLEREFTGYVDERGADVPESALSEPWCKQASIAIATMARAQGVSDVGMTLAAPARRAFLEEFCGGDERYLNGFDVVYAWRCDCPEQTVFVVRSFDDFPDDPGFYGSCPRCGAVALFVEEA